MSQLIVINDPVSCERRDFALMPGETMAHALMRLWPAGITGAWRVYREIIGEANELAAVDLPRVTIVEGATYYIVRDMAGPTYLLAHPAFATALGNAWFTAAFTLATAAIMQKVRHRRDDPDRISPNNAIAGQTNLLRPGARVPEILGRVRVYPDLLCNPVDVYSGSEQTIGQMFVLGKGSYDIELDTRKLGETPLSSIDHADLDDFPPGTLVDPFYVLKNSREVNDISLLGNTSGAIATTGDFDFIAAGKIMRTEELLPISVGKPIRVSSTFFNNTVFWVESVPAITDTTPPFDYVLDGPVVDELNINAKVTQLVESISFSRKIYYGNGGQFNWPEEDDDSPPDDQQVQFGYGWPGEDLIPKVQDYVEFKTKTGERWRGRLTAVAWPLGNRALFWGVAMMDLYEHPQVFPSISGRDSTYKSYRLPGIDDEEPPVGAPPVSANYNSPTAWYAAPMDNPQEIWLDFAFPSGLAWYDHGSRRQLAVQMKAEFRRAGATEAQAEAIFDFSEGTPNPLRFTRRVSVAALGLPAGSDTIEVRVQRVTDYYTDNTNNQYIQDTRWARMAAVRQLIQQTYDEATVLSLTVSNSRGTTLTTDMALNFMCTRILPSWSAAGGWTDPAPTRKWADNFVARCLADDGAHRTEAQLDLAGIYGIQDTLDSFDEGAQGEISMTLDQMQDIDAELAQIADVARAVVYRVGRKIFVTRDQADTNPIALFNARTKGPDGESVGVRMTGDADSDCVQLTWVDEALGSKQRDYFYPDTPEVLRLNPLRVGSVFANWPQVYRRALFEWNKLKYRRQQMSVSVTEDGRICRPGDVINVTDDIATLATCAGEVLVVAGNTLTLDRDVVTGAGTSFVILLRDNAGILTDLVPCTLGAEANQVVLDRTPHVAIKGRESSMGTMFAFYPVDTSPVRPWLVLGIETAGPYVTLAATNYTPKVYTGDSAPMPDRPGPPNLSL